MGSPNDSILDEVRYDRQFADRYDWCEAKGFSLVEPKIIDLDEIRREWAEKGWDAEQAARLRFGSKPLFKHA
ncbi:MAG: hypothetical protein KKE73_02250 [Proteobacteria bacterium]|nr:hypothetical protein [Pseudomonadota bacterium]